MKMCSVDELKGTLKNKENVLIDCRTSSEYHDKHIQGAILHPLGNSLESLLPFKDKTIYVICRSGARSHHFCLELEATGFKNAINVEGGMIMWMMKNFPVEKS